MRVSKRLTFVLSGPQRHDARPGLEKMYRVLPGRAWWPAVGAPLERGVRHRWCRQLDLDSAVLNLNCFATRISRVRNKRQIYIERVEHARKLEIIVAL